ncbi:MAG: hypothetical protein ACOCXJ_00665 [Planctomycetota bacterium]
MRTVVSTRSGSVLLLAMTAIAVLTVLMAQATMSAAQLRAHQQRQEALRAQRLAHDRALAALHAGLEAGHRPAPGLSGSSGGLQWRIVQLRQEQDLVLATIQVRTVGGAGCDSTVRFRKHSDGWRLDAYTAPR